MKIRKLLIFTIVLFISFLSFISFALAEENEELEYVINNVTTEFYDGDEPLFTGVLGSDQYILYTEAWFTKGGESGDIIAASNPSVNDNFASDNRVFTNFEAGKTYNYSLTILVENNNSDYYPKSSEGIVLVVNGERHICNAYDFDRTELNGVRYNFFQCDNIITITIPYNISDEDVILNEESLEYTGSEIEAPVTVKVGDKELVKDEDYTLSYEDNIDAGVASVTVKGIGNYHGEVTKKFNINRKNVVIAIDEVGDYVYTGEEIIPDLVVRYGDVPIKSNEYIAKITNNVNVGIALIEISSSNHNYEFEEIIGSFMIIPLTIEEKDVVLDKETVTYNGEPIKLNVTITINNKVLTEDDYDITYKDNIEIGEASIIITGKGNYDGKVIKHFNIEAKSNEEEKVNSNETYIEEKNANNIVDNKKDDNVVDELEVAPNTGLDLNINKEITISPFILILIFICIMVIKNKTV